MILEKQFKTVFALDKLNDPNTEPLPKNDQNWNPAYPAFNWKFKEGCVPEPDEWGLVQISFYEFKQDGVVRSDKTGRPVRKTVAVPHSILLEPNPQPVTAKAPGVIKAAPQCPQRKLSETEDIMKEPFTGWLVVDLATRVETEEQEEDRQSDEILTIVKENNAMLKQLVAGK